MKSFLVLALLWVTSAGASANSGALVDPALIPFAHGDSHSIARVIVLFQVPSHLSFPRKNHPDEVVSFLQKVSEISWQEAQSELHSANPNPHDLHLVKLNWINDSATFDVSPQGLKQLAQLGVVKKIYSNQPVQIAEKPLHFKQSHGYDYPSSTPPYNFDEMSLTELMKEMPQIDGTGVLIGTNDTGVDGTHPALQGKIFRFYDLATDKVGTPYDTEDHGTHTTGIMVGGNRTDNIFGVAPGAQIMMAGGKDARHDSTLDGMAYMLDPDGDKSTTHIPHMINNSWTLGPEADVESYYRAISAWDAAGIFIVFSAGNEGPDPQTISPPHAHPAVFAIAASGMDGNLTDFSSRGPATYEGQTVQKPDLTAPGEGIISCIPKNDYAFMDGTSMSAPAVTAVSALMLQANPALTSAQIKSILIQTATPRQDHGTPTWDAGYGYGKINALAAVKAAMSLKQMNVHQGLVPELWETLILSPSFSQLQHFNSLSLSGDETADQIFNFPESTRGMVSAELLY